MKRVIRLVKKCNNSKKNLCSFAVKCKKVATIATPPMNGFLIGKYMAKNPQKHI
jgi:hypothetical protein